MSNAVITIRLSQRALLCSLTSDSAQPVEHCPRPASCSSCVCVHGLSDFSVKIEAEEPHPRRHTYHAGLMAPLHSHAHAGGQRSCV